MAIYFTLKSNCLTINYKVTKATTIEYIYKLNSYIIIFYIYLVALILI